MKQKANSYSPWLHSFLFLLLFTSSTSCEEVGVFRKPRWVGIVSNDTPYSIKIDAYSKSVKQDSLEIAPNKSFERKLSEFETQFAEGIFFKENEYSPNNLIDSVE